METSASLKFSDVAVSKTGHVELNIRPPGITLECAAHRMPRQGLGSRFQYQIPHPTPATSTPEYAKFIANVKKLSTNHTNNLPHPPPPAAAECLTDKSGLLITGGTIRHNLMAGSIIDSYCFTFRFRSNKNKHLSL